MYPASIPTWGPVYDGTPGRGLVAGLRLGTKRGAWYRTPVAAPAGYYGPVPYGWARVFPRAFIGVSEGNQAECAHRELILPRVGKPNAYFATLSPSHTRRVSPRAFL
jgi:hypothetical protein